ncbi:glycosyltransferase family 2 protein [Aliiglaciecola sp. M165]|uniref:glycosyltransferase family 2 protein n=1 Tax=Aliiglaciecola sp. M165 TaxID=2593649 RepID=UPI00117D1B4A|nr:glycosyltransferase [Aliiglaciecola sp. M165]TRY30778.1 glycosyltransferase [Aliiglaciecola sp. M165]
MVLKSIAIKTLKVLVSIIPEVVKKPLKNHALIHEWYARSLRNSGMFFGYPTESQIEKLYRKYRMERVKWVEKQKPKERFAEISVILILEKWDLEKIERTIESLRVAKMSLSAFFLQKKCEDRTLEIKNKFPSIPSISLLDQFNIENSVLLINCGDIVNSQLVKAANTFTNTATDICYFDTDYYKKNDEYCSPRFYPKWDPELQLSTGYIRTGVLLKCSNVLKNKELFNCLYSGGITSFMCSLALESNPLKLDRVPHAVVSEPVQNKLTLKRHLDGEELKEKISKYSVKWHKSGYYSVERKLEKKPLVTLVIPTFNGKDLVEACISSILDKTIYEELEVLLVDNNSDDPEALAYFDELSKIEKVRLLKYPFPFNYSAINNFAVKHAKGEIIGLINNDIEVVSANWLCAMISHLMQEGVGCVGAKLLYSDNRVQHAGVVLGYGGGAGHAHKYFPHDHSGYLSRLEATGSFSAVTAACLVVRKTDYLQIGGLDEKNLQVAFNDVDFCLKLAQRGLRNIYCAESVLYHHESVSRGLDIEPMKRERFKRELSFIQKKWKTYIDDDPCYNPALTLKRENFAIKDIIREKY